MLPTRVLYSILISALFAAPAYSQTPAKKEAAGDAVAIEFKGGSLDDFVGLLRKKFPNSNIVVDKVGDIKLPEAPLGKVALPLALEWISKTADSRNRGLLLQTSRTGRDAGEVFLLTTTQAPAPRVPTLEEPFTKPYRLDAPEDGEGSRKPDVIRKAVEDHLKMHAPEGKAIVTYNAESKLMTLHNATRTDLILADKVVDEMKRGQIALGPVIQTLQADIEKLKKRIADLEKKANPEKKNEQ